MDESAQDRLKTLHMAAADQRWERAVDRVRQYFHYRDPTVRALTKRVLTVGRSVLWRVLGGDSRSQELMPYGPVPYAPVEVLEFLRTFIGWAILDDGDPGVGYMRYDLMKGELVPCAQDHMHYDPEEPECEPYADAEPYFHQSLEHLRETYPEAVYLTAERALEVLEWHAKQQAQHDAWDIEDAKEEGVDPPQPSEKALLLRQLAEELSA